MEINDLNPNYTFENFIVGNNNKFAYERALEVADKPAGVYNPLFIYGVNGLGKTHLLQAIGNKILQNNPNFKICYIRIDELLDKIIKSIKELDENNESLLYKFNNIDVLMIDDIQFISGKERCQDVLLKLFNKLYDYGKQIIITSDRHPEQIIEIKASLQNRFIWGIIAEISTHNYRKNKE